MSQARWRRRAAWFAAAVCALVCRSAPASASPRSWQPITFKGAQFSALCGTTTDKIEVIAFHGGKAEPIPFQIDEVLPDLHYALPSGPKPTPERTPKVLDVRDEIVMMISDFGERASPLDAFEIELHDPLGGQDRFAYIDASDHPRISPVKYVEYEPERDTIESEHYRLGFTHGIPTDYAMQSRMHSGAPNMIDRFKIRVGAKVLKLFIFRVNEDAVENGLLAWHAGPIRIVRRLSHSVHVILGISAPAVTNLDFFYRDSVENPFRLRFPWIPRLLFGDIHVRFDFDFLDLEGYSIGWSGLGGPPLPIREAAAKLAAGDTRANWIAIRGGGRVILQRIESNELNLLDRRLYFNDSGRPDPPERDVGEHPGIGYTFTGWENLGAGEHRLTSMLIEASDRYDSGALMREYESAPAVTIRPPAAQR